MTDWKFLWEKYIWNRTLGIPPCYESAVIPVFERTIGGCLIDVGANAGMYSIRFRKNFHHVFAIEPDPKMIRRLRLGKISHLAWNLRVLPFAASDSNGKIPLFLDGMGRTESFTYRPASHPKIEISYSDDARRIIIIDTMRLDDYPFPPDIGLIKIDVEGAEFRVLEGGEKTVRNAERIIVELHDRERKKELTRMINARFDEVRWLDADHIYGRNFKPGMLDYE